MGLVTAKEVAKAINLDKYGLLGTFMGWSLMHITQLSSINSFYKKHKHLQGLEFLDAILDHYEIDFEIPEEDFKRLPKDGAFITISNHPLGGIDGVLLLKLMLQHRSDFKIIANFLLHRIAPMSPYIIPVNPFEDRKDVKSSLAGFKSALRAPAARASIGYFSGRGGIHLQGRTANSRQTMGRSGHQADPQGEGARCTDIFPCQEQQTVLYLIQDQCYFPDGQAAFRSNYPTKQVDQGTDRASHFGRCSNGTKLVGGIYGTVAHEDLHAGAWLCKGAAY